MWRKFGDTANSARKKWSSVWVGDFSLSLSLSLSLVSFLFAICFFNFLNLFARLVILSVATQRVARRKPQQKNPHKLKENLPFLDTSLAPSMTNLGFCLKITDISTQNSKHFINLSQILSFMQGFFIFLPQIFAQFLLINSTQKEKQWLSQKNSKGI